MFKTLHVIFQLFKVGWESEDASEHEKSNFMKTHIDIACFYNRRTDANLIATMCSWLDEDPDPAL